MQRMSNQRVKSFPIVGTYSAGCHTQAEEEAKPWAHALFLQEHGYEAKGKGMESGLEPRGNYKGCHWDFEMLVCNKHRQGDGGGASFLESSCFLMMVYRRNNYKETV